MSDKTSDTISRQAAIAHAVPLNLFGREVMMVSVSELENLPSAQPEPIKVSVDREMTEEELTELKKKIADSPVVLLPSAQPDIIQCRNCKFASGDSRICMKFGHSPIGELDFCSWAERRTDETD